MRTLILRPGAIGDSLLTFPIIQRLREQDACPYVTLVGNPAVLPLAQAFGLAEEVANYDSPLWSELFSTRGIRTPALQSLLRQTQRAICWLADPEGIVKQNLLAAGVPSVLVTSSRPPQEKQHLHRVVYMAETVGLSPIDITAPFAPPRRIAPASTALDGFASAHDCAPIGIHPGSGGANKCWPIAHFRSLIERLCSQGQPVLLLAGPADHERLATLLDGLAPHRQNPTRTCHASLPLSISGPTERAMQQSDASLALSMTCPGEPFMARSSDKCLQTLLDAPLLEVASGLLQCKCYIGNDSAITHLAALLGIPTVAIFGASDPANWRPLGPTVKVVRAIPTHCMEQLAVDAVMEALETFSLDRSLAI